jgi:polysaccharide export outer membrane protein
MTHTNTILRASIVLRSLLALSFASLLATGCGGGGSQGVFLPPPQSNASSAAVEQFNRNLAMLAQPPAQQSASASPDYRLGPEDVLQITLFNIPREEEGVTPRQVDIRVSQEGMLTLPLVGNVKVAGLTPSELEQALRERYNKYLRNPQIGVRVTEFRSQRISVLGAVRSPNVYQLTGPKTLVDMLAMAGGITEKAGSQIHIYRQGPEGRQSLVFDLFALAGNPAVSSLPVQAGDVINVPDAGMFFVDGAVNRPGSYALSRPYTLSQALSVAGGVQVRLADFTEITIYRRRDATTFDRVQVNLKEVRGGDASDPRIEADDVIFVPISTAKFIVERFIGGIGLPSVPTPH